MKGLLFKDWVMLRKHGGVFLLFALAGGLAQGIRAVWTGGFDLPAVLGGAGAAAAMCGLAPAMQLPVLFRFGVEKGERVCVAQIGVLLLLLLLAALAVQGMPVWAAGFPVNLPRVGPGALAAALCAADAVLFPLSWLLSVRLCRRHL